MTENRSFPSLRAAMVPPPMERSWQERLGRAVRASSQSPRLGARAWVLWSSPARWVPAFAFVLAVLWTGVLLGALSLPDEELLPPFAVETETALPWAAQLDAENGAAAENGDGETDDLFEYFEYLLEEGDADEFQDWSLYVGL